MAKKVKKFVVSVVMICIAAALVFVPVLLAQDGKANVAAAVDESPVYSVKAAVAETRTLESYIEVNGDIVSDGQVAVFSETAGKVVAVKAKLGTRVQKGALIAQIDPSSPGLKYMVNSVYAPISGIICASPLAVGSTVQAGTLVTAVAETTDLQIEALIPEREVGQLVVGLTAEVTLPAFQGEVFAASITQVSPILDPASRTKKIVLTFTNSDSRINAGMFAHIKLNTRTYPNVVTVPAEAVGEQSGAKNVYVFDNGGTGNGKVEKREVVTGVTVDHITEIKSGLASGDAVVIQGQQFLTDGATVLVRK